MATTDFDLGKKDIARDKSLVYIPVNELYPHPLNPRRDLGDLTELTDSIRSNGILQNLTVQQGRYDDEGKFHETLEGYTVLIGHRRRAAAKLAGLETLPCVIVDISEAEQVQMMCMENMQRSDLTIYEQAVSFQMMLDFGGTVDEVAAKTGFSKTTIKRRLQMAKLDRDTMLAVAERQATLQDYDSLSRIENIETRNKVLCEIGTNNFNRALQKALDAEKDSRDCAGWTDIFKSNGYAEIPYAECYDRKYEGLGYVSGSPDTTKLNDILKGKTYDELFYAHGYSSTFYIRALKTAIGEEDEDLKREKEREAMRIRDEKLAEIAKRAFTLRFNFIKDFPLGESKKVAGTVVKWHFLKEIIGMYTVGRFSGYAAAQAGKDMYYKLFPFSSNEELAEFVNKHAEKALLMQVYAEWCDSPNERCWDWSATYHDSPKLRMLYACLCNLGYRMSDEERNMLDGNIRELSKNRDAVIDTALDEFDGNLDPEDADIDDILKSQLDELQKD